MNVQIPPKFRDKGAQALAALDYVSAGAECKWAPGDLIVWFGSTTDYHYVLATALHAHKPDVVMCAIIEASSCELNKRPTFCAEQTIYVVDQGFLWDPPKYFTGSKLRIALLDVEQEVEVARVSVSEDKAEYQYDLAVGKAILTRKESQFNHYVNNVIKL